MVCSTLGKTASMKRAFLHEDLRDHKVQDKWQEPGLWRPMWIIDREFFPIEYESKNLSRSRRNWLSRLIGFNRRKIVRDRMFVKLKPDKTVSVVHESLINRPFLDIFKKPIPKKLRNDFKAKKLSKKTVVEAAMDESDAFYGANGSWKWEDENPLPSNLLTIETIEGVTDESEGVRVNHEVRFDWGTTDEYASLFGRGKITKYKAGKLAIGAYEAGKFTIRANSRMPVVKKDFQGFQ